MNTGRPQRGVADGGSSSYQHHPKIDAGANSPLGATPTATGVNFALYSQHATDVSLLLYSADDGCPPM